MIIKDLRSSVGPFFMVKTIGGIYMREIMNVNECADYLRIKTPTVYYWYRNKNLPGIRVGKFLRFRRTELDFWLQPEKKKKPTI